MSLQAILWVMHKAPVEPNAKFRTLLELANFADDEGRAAFPSWRRLIEQTGLSRGSISRHLKELEADGLIRRGDQALVAHYRHDRRPVVWDLALELDRSKAPARVDSEATEDDLGADFGHSDDGLEAHAPVDNPVDNFQAGSKFETPLAGFESERGLATDGTGSRYGRNGVSPVRPNPINKPINKPINNPIIPCDGGHSDGSHVDGTGLAPSTSPADADSATKQKPYSEAFQKFYEVYPRKIGKRKAFNAWTRAVKRAPANAIHDGAVALADHHKRAGTDPRFIPHPTTWLNRDGWEDELTLPAHHPVASRGRNGFWDLLQEGGGHEPGGLEAGSNPAINPGR